MLNYKLQLGCFIIILYVAFTYYSECRKIQKQHKYILFDFLLIVGLIYYVLDILTVYMVNHLQTVNPTVNMVCHALFLGSIDLLVFLMFYYILDITDCIPRKHTYSPLLPWIPFIINEVVVFANMGSLEYRTGKVTNYSMGVSAYTCYIMVGVYFLLTAIVFLRRWRYFEAHKRNSIGVYMVISMGVMVYQMVFPESLVSSLAVTIIILCIYVFNVCYSLSINNCYKSSCNITTFVIFRFYWHKAIAIASIAVYKNGGNNKTSIELFISRCCQRKEYHQ